MNDDMFPDVEPPRSDEQLAKLKADSNAEAIRMGYGVQKFTCDECGYRDRCPLAYDLYNIDGDCLMDK